ncbi:hypothetical protein F383_24833 [Gossypium arboreum]|uniref:Uncharacterized protein n=1 Tax=Gossypium arboreum TaxID=29729 RepID=A0A0B0P0K7_GOSAR|nr:hypothetical protein F383_24833 [Gossypium arboreum]
MKIKGVSLGKLIQVSSSLLGLEL